MTKIGPFLAFSIMALGLALLSTSFVFTDVSVMQKSATIGFGSVFLPVGFFGVIVEGIKQAKREIDNEK